MKSEIEENQLYEELRKSIDKMPIGMPATESGVELRILKRLFTPQEAEISLNLNIIGEPLSKIRRCFHRKMSGTFSGGFPFEFESREYLYRRGLFRQ